MDDRVCGKDQGCRRDRAAALLLCIAVLFLGYINLDNNCNWGDDFAAYMADGIAMAEGRYEEQTRLNVILRSGRLADSQSEHVHVFGYPLTHAFVYSLAGFDTTDYSNLYLYKLPSLAALSIMAGIYFLFLRKRLGLSLSVLLTLALCTDMTLHNEIRNLCSDILFLALSMCSFYFMELYLEKPYGRGRTLLGIFLGLLLWYSYSVRLNGIVSVVCVLFAQLLWMLRDKKRFRFSELVPAGTLLLLFIIFNLFVFPRPTSTSSAGDVSFESFFRGLEYYLDMLQLWARRFVEIALDIPLQIAATLLYSLFDSAEICSVVSQTESFIFRHVFDFLAAVFLFFSLLGIVTEGIRKDIHIVLFLLASFIGTSALSLGQELRYLYVLLPFLLMYAALGGKWLAKRIFKEDVRTGRGINIFKYALLVILCIFSIVPITKSGITNIRNNAQEDLTAYSDAAIEAYNYIQDELNEDDSIAFFKPRALYLNTGRVSLLPQDGGFEITDADYYLYYIPSEEMLISEELEPLYEPCFENYEFVLYRKLDQ